MFERYRQESPTSHFLSLVGSSASRLWLYRTRTFALEPDPRRRLQSQPAFLAGGPRREFSSAIGTSCLPQNLPHPSTFPCQTPASAFWLMPRKKQIGWQASRSAPNICCWACCGKKNRTCRKRSQQWESIFTRQEIGSDKNAGYRSLTASQTTKRFP